LRIDVDRVKRRTLPHVARSIPISLHMRVLLEVSSDVTSTTLRTVALRQRGECDERRAERTSEHGICEQSPRWRTTA
jgi:hypothetical protein